MGRRLELCIVSASGTICSWLTFGFPSFSSFSLFFSSLVWRCHSPVLLLSLLCVVLCLLVSPALAQEQEKVAVVISSFSSSDSSCSGNATLRSWLSGISVPACFPEAQITGMGAGSIWVDAQNGANTATTIYYADSTFCGGKSSGSFGSIDNGVCDSFNGVDIIVSWGASSRYNFKASAFVSTGGTCGPDTPSTTTTLVTAGECYQVEILPSNVSSDSKKISSEQGPHRNRDSDVVCTLNNRR